jgi:hypothetical protein
MTYGIFPENDCLPKWVTTDQMHASSLMDMRLKDSKDIANFAIEDHSSENQVHVNDVYDIHICYTTMKIVDRLCKGE